MIDSKRQEELRAQFNPDGSDLRKMQLRMLEMLKYIDEICRENNIKYWLSSGTCLGAVRHGGFIPWDDDCDIEMEKPDFKKFCKVFKQKHKYELQTHSSDMEYLAPYAKLRDTDSFLIENNGNDKYYKYRGIYIDIFCIVPSSSLFLNKVSTLFQQSIYKITRVSNIFVRRTLISLVHPFCHKLIFPIISFISLFFNKGRYRHIPGTGFPFCRFKKDFQSVKYVQFEDTYLPIPQFDDEYLKNIYGEFQKIPPLETLHPHINKVIFK